MQDISLLVKKHILNDSLKWDSVNSTYLEILSLFNKNHSKHYEILLEEISQTKEALELMLQKSQIQLDCTDDIYVKVNPDYLNLYFVLNAKEKVRYNL